MAVISINKPKWLTDAVPEQVTVIPKETFLKERVESGGRQPVAAVLNKDEEVVPAPVVDALGGSQGVTKALSNDLPPGQSLTGDTGRVGPEGYNIKGIACGTVGKIKNLASGTVGGIKNHALGTLDSSLSSQMSGVLSQLPKEQQAPIGTPSSAASPTVQGTIRTTVARPVTTAAPTYAAPVTGVASGVTPPVTGPTVVTPTYAAPVTGVASPALSLDNAIAAWGASGGRTDLPAGFDPTKLTSAQRIAYNTAKASIQAANGVTAESASGGRTTTTATQQQGVASVAPDLTAMQTAAGGAVGNALQADAAKAIDNAIAAWGASGGRTDLPAGFDVTKLTSAQRIAYNTAKAAIQSANGVTAAAASGGRTTTSTDQKQGEGSLTAGVGVRGQAYTGPSSTTRAESPADKAARERLQADLQLRSTAAQQGAAQDLAQRGIKGSAASTVLSEQAAQAESARASAGADLAEKQAELAATASEAEKGRQFQTGERLGSQDWQSLEAGLNRKFTSEEAEAVRKYQTGERLSTQEWQSLEAIAGRTFTTSERVAQQQFITGERTQSQDWQAVQTRLGREFDAAEAELVRKYQTGERLSTQEWQSMEALLGRTFTTDERLAIQKYQAGERLLDREWQTVENALGRTFTTSERVAAQKFATATDALNLAFTTGSYDDFNTIMKELDPSMPDMNFSELTTEKQISQLVDLADRYPDLAEIFMEPAMTAWKTMTGVDIDLDALHEAITDLESGQWDTPAAQALVSNTTTGVLQFLDTSDGATYTDQMERAMGPEQWALATGDPPADDAPQADKDAYNAAQERLGELAETAFWIHNSAASGTWRPEQVRDAVNMGFTVPSDADYTLPEDRTSADDPVDWGTYFSGARTTDPEYQRVLSKVPAFQQQSPSLVKVSGEGSANDYYDYGALHTAMDNKSVISKDGVLYAVVSRALPGETGGVSGRATYTLRNVLTGETTTVSKP